MSFAKPLDELTVVGLDLETTGLSAWRGDQVCEVGMVLSRPGHMEDRVSMFVNPGRPIPTVVQSLTGIRDEDVADAPAFADVLGDLLEVIADHALVIHNAPFDLAFFHQACTAAGRPEPSNLTLDTLLIARFLSGGRQPSSLGSVCDRLGIHRERAHRAIDDARAAVQVFRAQLSLLRDRGLTSVGDLVRQRVAADATELVAAPSSVLLDMLTRAIRFGGEVQMVYSRPPGTKIYRVRPVELVADRELVAEIVSASVSDRAGVVRTFQAIDILQLDYDGKTFWSPWRPVSSEPAG
jgi:DNA polymerase III epsilon subunit family exonuclease